EDACPLQVRILALDATVGLVANPETNRLSGVRRQVVGERLVAVADAVDTDLREVRGSISVEARRVEPGPVATPCGRLHLEVGVVVVLLDVELRLEGQGRATLRDR